MLEPLYEAFSFCKKKKEASMSLFVADLVHMSLKLWESKPDNFFDLIINYCSIENGAGNQILNSMSKDMRDKIEVSFYLI